MSSAKTQLAPSPLLNQLMGRADIHRNTPDNSWDYLNHLAVSWQNNLVAINNIVTQAVQFLDASQKYTGEARVLVEGIMGELQIHATKWRTLSETHRGRSGLGVGPAEHSLILETGLEYVQSNQQFMNSVSYSAPRLQELIIQEEYNQRSWIASQEQALQANATISSSLNNNI